MDEQYPDCISAEERNANGVLELRNKLNTRAALYYLVCFLHIYFNLNLLILFIIFIII